MKKITVIIICIIITSSAIVGAVLLNLDTINSKDTTPPSINLISPANNSIFIAGTIIDFQITDSNLRFVDYWINNVTNEILETPFDINTMGWADGVKDLKIVATDEKSNKMVGFYSFIIDSTTPQTLISPDNNSLIRPGDIISIEISDANIDFFNYSINGARFQNFTSPLNINTQDWNDGNYILIINAIDKAGNTIVENYKFILSTQPAITLTIGYPQLNRTIDNKSIIYVSGSTEFNITAGSGNASEISDIWFRIWNPGHPFIGEGPGGHLQTIIFQRWSSWIKYYGNFSFTDPELPLSYDERYDDLHHVEYYYSDIYGYNCSIQKISIILDKYGPDTQITPYAEQNYPIDVNSNTVFNMTAMDWTYGSSSPGVGFNITWYRIWNGSYWTSWITYSGNFTLSGPAGLYYIEYYSVDDFGNMEAIRRADYNFNPN
jgi:hypothetical protein